jgi:hypothetical protein
MLETINVGWLVSLAICRAFFHSVVMASATKSQPVLAFSAGLSHGARGNVTSVDRGSA